MLKQFGTLLRQLRGDTPLSQIAERVGVSKSHLVNLETGRKVPREERARAILRDGFDLTEAEIARSLLDLHLQDYGVTDGELRNLILDLALGRLPATTVRDIRRRYRQWLGSSLP